VIKIKNMQDENKNKKDDFLLEDDLEIDPSSNNKEDDYADYNPIKDEDNGNASEDAEEINKDDYIAEEEKEDDSESDEINDYYKAEDDDRNGDEEENDNENNKDYNIEEEDYDAQDEKEENNFYNNDIKEEDQEEGEDDEYYEDSEKEEKDNFFNNNKNDKIDEKKEDACMVSKSKIILARSILENIKDNSEKLLNIFSNFVDDDQIAKISLSQFGENYKNEEKAEEQKGSIIEGVFDGENMIGPDGKQYSVPANYASKSKLVEGDILKLTITGSGTFVYKQIGPIERIRVVGELEKGNDDSFFVSSEGRKWRILPASVTYFKGQIGDEVVLLIPKSGESKWAAVENIIRNKDEEDSD
jgi:hypothetical protein